MAVAGPLFGLVCVIGGAVGMAFGLRVVSGVGFIIGGLIFVWGSYRGWKKFNAGDVPDRES